MTTFSEISHCQATALESEVSRLEDLLIANPDWRALCAVEAKLSSSRLKRADRAAYNVRRRRLHEHLSHNSVYVAVMRLREAVATMGLSNGPSAARNVASCANADDLTLISRIDARTAAALHHHGVTSFSQIAKWTVEEVADASVRLGLGWRSGRECWIEQAAILAEGRLTAYAADRLGQPDGLFRKTWSSATTAAKRRFEHKAQARVTRHTQPRPLSIAARCDLIPTISRWPSGAAANDIAAVCEQPVTGSAPWISCLGQAIDVEVNLAPPARLEAQRPPLLRQQPVTPGSSVSERTNAVDEYNRAVTGFEDGRRHWQLPPPLEMKPRIRCANGEGHAPTRLPQLLTESEWDYLIEPQADAAVVLEDASVEIPSLRIEMPQLSRMDKMLQTIARFTSSTRLPGSGQTAAD